MTKINVFSLVFALVFGISQAHADGRAAVSHVYAVGYSDNRILIPGYWLDGNWQELSIVDVRYQTTATAMSVSNGHVYIGGNSISAQGDGQRMGGYWTDGKWRELRGWGETVIRSINAAGNHVYVGGFTRDSGLSPIASYWVDGEFKPLADLGGGTDSEVASIEVDSAGHVYAAGTMGWRDNMRAGYWLDRTWTELHAPAGTYNAGVGNIQLSDGHVYVSGFAAQRAENYTNEWRAAGYWRDGEWVELSAPSQYRFNSAASVFVKDGHVYVGGVVRKEARGTIPVPAYWVDGVFHALPNLDISRGADVRSLQVSDDGHVYIGGTMFYADQDRPGYWLDGTWVPVQRVRKDGYVLGIVLQ